MGEFCHTTTAAAAAQISPILFRLCVVVCNCVCPSHLYSTVNNRCQPGVAFFGKYMGASTGVAPKGDQGRVIISDYPAKHLA